MDKLAISVTSIELLHGMSFETNKLYGAHVFELKFYVINLSFGVEVMANRDCIFQDRMDD